MGYDQDNSSLIMLQMLQLIKQVSKNYRNSFDILGLQQRVSEMS